MPVSFLDDIALPRDPSSGLLAVTKQYTDNQDALKVTKAGDTMTGLLVLSADPSAALGAATKQYVDGKVAGGGGITRSISTISGATTALAVANTDYVYICSAALTLTLPTAVGNKNLYTVKRTGTGNITVATTSSQTIDGLTTFVLDTAWMSIDLISDNANWFVV